MGLIMRDILKGKLIEAAALAMLWSTSGRGRGGVQCEGLWLLRACFLVALCCLCSELHVVFAQ